MKSNKFSVQWNKVVSGVNRVTGFLINGTKVYLGMSKSQDKTISELK